VKFGDITADALDEWRAIPVTMLAQAALRRALDLEYEALTAAFWSGEPVPEADRLAHKRKEALWEDLFQSSIEDFIAAAEGKRE
jgi:hypothetical protein